MFSKQLLADSTTS